MISEEGGEGRKVAGGRMAVQRRTVENNSAWKDWEPERAHKSYFTMTNAITKVNTAHSLFSVFLGPHPRHMEVPRLGVSSEL